MPMNPGVKFLCHVCKKSRPTVTDIKTNSCFRCRLKGNKVFLMRCFDSIVVQPQMKEFKGDMETWYLYDV